VETGDNVVEKQTHKIVFLFIRIIIVRHKHGATDNVMNLKVQVK